MYGLPKNFDGSFLAGRTVEMVCFNLSQIYLHLSDQVTITVEAAFSYQRAGAGDASRLSVPVRESNLMQLLGSKIAEVSGDENGTLSLMFDNGDMFCCYDASPNYESYQIKYGDQLIIV